MSGYCQNCNLPIWGGRACQCGTMQFQHQSQNIPQNQYAYHYESRIEEKLDEILRRLDKIEAGFRPVEKDEK